MKSKVSNLLKISALLMIIIIAVSCGRNKLPKNYYKIGEDVYEITSGEIINKGEVDGGFDLELRLCCENGKDFISFKVISDQAEKLPYTTLNNPEGSWIIGYNNGTYSSIGTISSGKVVIDRSKEGYIIEIECIDQYSNKVEGYFKDELNKKDENNLVHVVPEYVIPNEIYDEVTELLPLYEGLTPPNMTGEYVSSPHILFYESYAENPDSIQYYSDRYVGFIYDSKQMNFYAKQYDPEEDKYIEEIQYGVKITGENDNFTCYYVVDGYPGGYYAQQAFIFSGKKTNDGIEDFHTAVVMLETSGHPELPEKNSYRVLKDEDGLAENNNWLSKRSNTSVKKLDDEDLFKIWIQ